MNLADLVLVFLWGGISAYVLFGGADFGAGFWDLCAGRAANGAAQRHRIEESIGPVWEANHADAPALFSGLTARGLGLIIATAVFGVVSLGLLVARRYVAVRITAALAVVAVLWGCAVAQYPDVLVGTISVTSAAAPHDTLVALVASLSGGMVLLLPSLLLLFRLFQMAPKEGA